MKVFEHYVLRKKWNVVEIVFPKAWHYYCTT